MSFDSVEENCAFAEKFDFNYSLLSDTTRTMSVAYGAAKDPHAKYPDRNACQPCLLPLVAFLPLS